MSMEIWHHGIKGQKWGVRRTPAQLGHETGGSGKSRSDDSNAETSSEKAPRRTSKSSQKMTDQELRDAINRLNMEEQYDNLVAKQKDRNTGVIKKAMSNAFANLATKSFDYAMNWAFDKIFTKEDPDKELREELAHLTLENQHADQAKKKHDRENPKTPFDASQWRDKNASEMDYETAKKMAEYWKNAKALTLDKSQTLSKQHSSQQSQQSQQSQKNKATKSQWQTSQSPQYKQWSPK